MKTIVRSRHIFDGTGSNPCKGYIEFEGPLLSKVERGWNYAIDSTTQLIQSDDLFVMPGIHDNHVFFSGWLAANAGIDLRRASSPEEAMDLLSLAMEQMPGQAIYAHGWNRRKWARQPTRRMLDRMSKTVPIVAIDAERSAYWMNTAAIARYGFQEADIAAEKRHRLIREMTSNKELVREGWGRFQKLLLSRGVVSCKDIVFDDCAVHELIDDHVLDVTMYIEAVENEPDISQIQHVVNRDFAEGVRFGGVKIMVDGVVADGTGDIYGRYLNEVESPAVDYDRIELLVARLSDNAISCCLTAEGDKAIDRSAEILARHSTALTHHSISDLEMVTDYAANIMARSGITAEIYPQILGLNRSKADAYMSKTILGDDGSDFYTYKNLSGNRTSVTCGTDCPLFITSVPQSVLRASRRRFDSGAERWFPDSAMPTSELLQAWASNGASQNSRTLQRGNPSTFVIFDRDLTSASDDELRSAAVVQTFVDGKSVCTDIERDNDEAQRQD